MAKIGRIGLIMAAQQGTKGPKEPKIDTPPDVTPSGGPPQDEIAIVRGALEDVQIFDAVAVSTATIASHFAYLGAISSWLVRHRVSSDEATRYVATMFAGLAPALQSGESLDRLAKDHATRGGTNELFLVHLTQSGLFDSVEQGLDKVLRRLVEFGAQGALREHQSGGSGG